MYEQKKTKSLVWATALTLLIAGLLVGCTPSEGNSGVAYSYPAPSEAPAVVGTSPVGEAMTDTPTSPLLEDPLIANLVEIARKDLAGRLSISLDQINLLEVRQVTWPDSSLGCPQARMAYAQEPQAGLLIRLRAAGNMYFYHSNMSSEPFLCENTPVFPKSRPEYDELVPPPDHEID